eukprot:scaffold496_cov119-Isochrysis_galbana.AAC.11
MRGRRGCTHRCPISHPSPRVCPPLSTVNNATHLAIIDDRAHRVALARLGGLEPHQDPGSNALGA